MATGTGTYHQQLAEQKRGAILDAATRLFMADGYAGASLARVAQDAEVSRATLFKQFPTKASLFEAVVTHQWAATSDDRDTPEPGDLARGLRTYGRRYAALMSRPEMVGLYRLVIAEMPRFPQVAQTQFETGKMPFFRELEDYLRAEHAAGTARVDDAVLAASNFLGMVGGYAFWPRLMVVGWDPTPAEVEHAVDEAVATAVARYSVA
ncbi:TetR/AcrR family transcriptional regulator [Promicromonospora thailandica]|uniref:Transcriptional regulator, TetR family n=1 Tax=Promicromonospora thailandica TaxID=765201 RepID=A0A9X2JX74_9MICO|nr:TetR/AcrR family transcriptional regulator [Promicromonospora thailandica]MCP2266941.1 transcriptional regulator, TetR family [Promicromonospora thailandica]BFF16791.1 TetR/AcrR family transcriptional regulator [Promicromonospora thailandica]